MRKVVGTDGLPTPIVGDWAEEKYRLVECYARIFATSMKNKWDARAYIDLFSGSGMARVRGTTRITETAAMRALGISDPFDRYIFCEIDRLKLDALQSRVALRYPGRDIHYVHGDSNERIEEIMAKIPSPSAKTTVLSFCFADPYMLRNLHFLTIRRLSDLFVDFVVLIPTGMDPGRNERKYLRLDNENVARFTGQNDWREERKNERSLPFGDFVALQFGKSMSQLGYLFKGLSDMHEMRNTKRKSPIYRLALFSRKDLGPKFWEECRKYASNQRTLF